MIPHEAGWILLALALIGWIVTASNAGPAPQRVVVRSVRTRTCRYGRPRGV